MCQFDGFRMHGGGMKNSCEKFLTNPSRPFVNVVELRSHELFPLICDPSRGRRVLFRSFPGVSASGPQPPANGFNPSGITIVALKEKAPLLGAVTGTSLHFD
jgi:hypothetical protein